MNIKFWYCKTCKRVLERKKFPKYFDANTPCKRCQSGIVAAIDTDQAAGQDAPAFVRVRPQRRNGRDNRE